ncbi:MAG: hypothetical protein JXD23_13740 [Spirochaetales bacterium]|nr:hypothetical protein [Spirochaetales bacterium]
MTRIRFGIFIVGLFLCSSTGIFAQLVIDPQDGLYEHITVWESKGYVMSLPLLRPYPINLLIKILKVVAEKGDDVEREIAQRYLDGLRTELTKTAPDKLLPSPFGVRIGNGFWTDFEHYLYDCRPFVTAQGSYGILSFSGLATIGFQLSNGYPAPAYTQISDEAQSGGGSAVIGGVDFQGRNIGLGGVFVGTENIWLQAGIFRSSIGPFFDNGVVLGPQCPGAGHISYTWNIDWFKFTSILLIVNPAFVEDPATGLKTPISTINTPGSSHTLSFEKYIVLHSYTFHPFDCWTFGILQSIVFGGGFNPAYLFPLQHLPFTSLLFGEHDSSYLGFYSSLKLPLGLRFDFMFYLDDFNFNKFIGGDGTFFDLNSGQNKFALQAGLSWTPRIQGLRRVSFDYTMITPYTFTQDSTAVVNYLNYVHEDSGIGTILQPNSDRLNLTVALQPAPWLSIDCFSRFIRHGNASEGVPGLNGNGDYWDDGRDENGVVYFYGPMRFLTQSVLEMILQIGLSAKFQIRLGFALLDLGVGYVFEYGWNRNLVAYNDGAKHYVNLKVGIEF